MLKDTFNELREELDDMDEDLGFYKCGFVYDLKKNEQLDKLVFSHKINNFNDSNLFFSNIIKLGTNPFDTPKDELDEAKDKRNKPGRLTTDVGKTNRRYTQLEALILKSALQDDDFIGKKGDKSSLRRRIDDFLAECRYMTFFFLHFTWLVQTLGK